MLTLNDDRSELWQWDTGRRVTVDADCSQVHFSNKVFGRSIDVDVIDGSAIIPDILLQTDKDLSVWSFVGTAENGYTKISKVFKVNRRNKPADYVFTPPDQTSIEEIKEKLEHLESIQDPDAIKNAVEDYLEHNPVEAPVQSVNGKTGKVKLTAEDVGAISQDDLQEATNKALAQAKESGKFDGDDYVLTPDDKTEIAELAAELVEVPDSGGNVDYVGVEPAEDDMPKVFITGVKPTTKDDVLAEMQYISKTEKFHAYLEIKCQGTSSMSYAKKNFTVKLYSDEARETKLKKNFKGWNHESNKFVLKANYIDHAHARNIVSARLWGEIVASRPDYTALPVEMRNAPNNGAVDGFPIKVYYNGNYEGVYTWNIGKDDWMWGMDEDNANHVLLCAEGNTDGVYAETTSNFRALWNGVDGQKPGWSVEVGTNSTALKTSLNNLIQFVMDNDGDAFRNGIGNYLDIQSAIDYYIFQYEICGLDGLAHNMLLATYDGVVWRCGAYDLDATFGLYWNGSKFVSAQYRCPEDYQEAYSLLWERIEANFAPELKARQEELRKTVLSYSNIVTHFERFMDIIGLDLYAEDLTIYTGIPSGSTNNIKQIRNYIRDRQAYVDAEFAAMSEGGEEEPDEPDVPETVPCTGITLDKTELTFDGEGTQTITTTVTPADTTDTAVWVSSAPDVASITVTGNICTVQSVRNGDATITVTCGEYSASCSVSVSGIELSEPYYSWSDENIYEINADGTVTETSDKYVTNLFDVPYGSYRIVNNTGKQVWGYLAQYDSDGNFVTRVSFGGLEHGGASSWISVCEDSPSKLRIAAHIKDGIVLERSDGIWSEIACYAAPKTGAIQYLYNNQQSSFMTQKKIAVEGGKTYTLANKNGGAFQYKGVSEYKADGSFVKFEQQGGITTPYTTTLDAETAYVYLIAGTSTDPNNCLEFTMVE